MSEQLTTDEIRRKAEQGVETLNVINHNLKDRHAKAQHHLANIVSYQTVLSKNISDLKELKEQFKSSRVDNKEIERLFELYLEVVQPHHQTIINQTIIKDYNDARRDIKKIIAEIETITRESGLKEIEMKLASLRKEFNDRTVLFTEYYNKYFHYYSSGQIMNYFATETKQKFDDLIKFNDATLDNAFFSKIIQFTRELQQTSDALAKKANILTQLYESQVTKLLSFADHVKDLREKNLAKMKEIDRTLKTETEPDIKESINYFKEIHEDKFLIGLLTQHMTLYLNEKHGGKIESDLEQQLNEFVEEYGRKKQTISPALKEIDEQYQKIAENDPKKEEKLKNVKKKLLLMIDKEKTKLKESTARFSKLKKIHEINNKAEGVITDVKKSVEETITKTRELNAITSQLSVRESPEYQIRSEEIRTAFEKSDAQNQKKKDPRAIRALESIRILIYKDEKSYSNLKNSIKKDENRLNIVKGKQLNLENGSKELFGEKSSTRATTIILITTITRKPNPQINSKVLDEIISTNSAGLINLLKEVKRKEYAQFKKDNPHLHSAFSSINS